MKAGLNISHVTLSSTVLQLRFYSYLADPALSVPEGRMRAEMRKGTPASSGGPNLYLFDQVWRLTMIRLVEGYSI